MKTELMLLFFAIVSNFPGNCFGEQIVYRIEVRDSVSTNLQDVNQALQIGKFLRVDVAKNKVDEIAARLMKINRLKLAEAQKRDEKVTVSERLEEPCGWVWKKDLTTGKMTLLWKFNAEGVPLDIMLKAVTDEGLKKEVLNLIKGATSLPE